MSLNVTSSISGASSTSQVSSSQTPETTQKSTTDSEFKDEMKKVSSKSETEDKKELKAEKTDDKKTLATDAKDEIKAAKDKSDKIKNEILSDAQENADDIRFASLSMIDNINNNLTNDIEMMINTNAIGNTYNLSNSLLSSINDKTFGNMMLLDYTNSMSMTESDAQFFINLTKNDNINTQAVVAQAQAALDNGAELSQVQQNVKISETLLNAINIAREKNQPLRIDFDQNISVIMRFGRDGSFAANFIPGDKVVEQYLKNNLESLKSTFDEKELPYSELSYSNRGSKQQKEKQRSQQQ